MNVDYDAVKKMYIQCKQLLLTMDDTSKKITRTYANAEEFWHDAHYRQLGNIIDDCNVSLKKTMMQITGILQKLDEVVAAINEYNSVNFYSGGGGSSHSSGVVMGISGASEEESFACPAEIIVNAGAEWSASLSAESRAAIRAYTGEAYANINSALRGQCGFTPGNGERACAIHDALSTASIPQNCTVYRGIRAEALGNYAHLPDQALVGCTITEPGFMSTSLYSDDAFSGAVLLQIEVPAGERGAYVGHVSQLGHGESEVLFDAGRQYEILSVTRDQDNRRIILARMYNDEQIPRLIHRRR